LAAGRRLAGGGGESRTRCQAPHKPAFWPARPRQGALYRERLTRAGRGTAANRAGFGGQQRSQQQALPERRNQVAYAPRTKRSCSLASARPRGSAWACGEPDAFAGLRFLQQPGRSGSGGKAAGGLARSSESKGGLSARSLKHGQGFARGRVGLKPLTPPREKGPPPRPTRLIGPISPEFHQPIGPKNASGPGPRDQPKGPGNDVQDRRASRGFPSWFDLRRAIWETSSGLPRATADLRPPDHSRSWIMAVGRGACWPLARTRATTARISPMRDSCAASGSSVPGRLRGLPEALAGQRRALRITTFHGRKAASPTRPAGPWEPSRARLVWEPSHRRSLANSQSCRLQKAPSTQALLDRANCPAPAALLEPDPACRPIQPIRIGQQMES